LKLGLERAFTHVYPLPLKGGTFYNKIFQKISIDISNDKYLDINGRNFLLSSFHFFFLVPNNCKVNFFPGKFFSM
jgi:hypothetical protein